jgi:glycosyltransferase involved in cell wall biosynthesis
MPVYNEAGAIAGVVADLTREVTALLDGAEIVLVDDGSTDATPGILDRLAAEHAHVTVIHAEANRGHGPSLRRAFETSRGEWLFQMDSDGQQVPAEFWDLWALRDDADLVVGVRRGRSEGWHRDAVTAAARWANRLVGGRALRDVNVPFKLIRRELWEDLADDVPRTPVAPSLLVAVGAALRGWRVAEVEVSHLPRRHGRSTVDLRLLARLTMGALVELVGFRRRIARRAPPAPRPDARTSSAASAP